jgi:hypothetical protein
VASLQLQDAEQLVSLDTADVHISATHQQGLRHGAAQVLGSDSVTELELQK